MNVVLKSALRNSDSIVSAIGIMWNFVCAIWWSGRSISVDILLIHYRPIAFSMGATYRGFSFIKISRRYDDLILPNLSITYFLDFARESLIFAESSFCLWRNRSHKSVLATINCSHISTTAFLSFLHIFIHIIFSANSEKMVSNNSSTVFGMNRIDDAVLLDAVPIQPLLVFGQYICHLWIELWICSPLRRI